MRIGLALVVGLFLLISLNVCKKICFQKVASIQIQLLKSTVHLLGRNLWLGTNISIIIAIVHHQALLLIFYIIRHQYCFRLNAYEFKIVGGALVERGGGGLQMVWLLASNMGFGSITVFFEYLAFKMSLNVQKMEEELNAPGAAFSK